MKKFFIHFYLLTLLVSCNPPGDSNSLTDVPGSPPSAPSGLARLTPQISIGLDSTPEFTVSGVVSGDTIKLFTDSNCSTEVGSMVAAGTSANITVASPLLLGHHSFYANATNAHGTSSCSTVSASYAYGRNLKQRLAVGPYNTFALTPEGGIKSWGLNKYNFNSFGMLGDGSLLTQYSPVSHATLTSNVSSVIGGGVFNLYALTSLGEVKIWSERFNLTDLSIFDDEVIQVSNSSQFTCALSSLGEVKCWGINNYGQFGNGTTDDADTELTPVQVLSNLIPGDHLSDIVSIAAGSQNACALTSLGTVKCWGRNASGQLGDGTTTQRSLPVDVMASSTPGDYLSNIVAITVGGAHTCALTSLGTVKCWGNNFFGQLGDGTTTQRSLPVDVMASSTPGDYLSNIVAITSGMSSDSTCALTSLGGVKCWGSNFFGTLGNGTQTNSSLPVDVFGLNSGVEEISVGQMYTCALTSLGGVKCWGLSADGRLGDGTTEFRFQTVPVDVINFP